MLEKSELGKKTQYKNHYDNSLLFSIERKKLNSINQEHVFGKDIWNVFELSWLNLKGKPEVRIAKVIFDCDSKNIIESKSLKLYFNSFNQSKFISSEEVLKIVSEDLKKAVEGGCEVCFLELRSYKDKIINSFSGHNLDILDVELNEYKVNRNDLHCEGDEIIEESLTSDLLKSNCLVTGQPDWASLFIYYRGRKISHSGLLKYIISFRNHNEFHEQCVERIFSDILSICAPNKLLVYARYTRRGGIDINPIRANFKYDTSMHNIRLVRQ